MYVASSARRGDREPGGRKRLPQGRAFPARYPDLGCRLNRARLVFLRLKEVHWDWLSLCLMFAVATFSTPLAHATPDCDVSRPDQVCAGSFLVRGSAGSFSSAPRLNTRVEVSISGIAARVSLHQTFKNDSADWIEGIYVFPLPDNAAVDRLKLRVGTRVVVGEIHERKEAKKVYEQAKASGRRAGLVEQERANLFTMSVANIAPGEIIEVEIGYLETLKYDNRQFSFRFPMTVTPRYVPGAALTRANDDTLKGFGWSRATDQVADAPRITPYMKLANESSGYRASIDVHIDAGFLLAYIVSPYHPVDVNEVGRLYELSLSEGRVPMDRDFELVWQPVTGPDSDVAIFSETNGDNSYVMLMFMPPQGGGPLPIPPRELVLVIDTSGSMHGESLRQAKSALQMALSRLRPEDQFNVIQFNSKTHSLFAHTVTADEPALVRAAAYVDGLSSNGGTEMMPALKAALSGPEMSGSHLKQVIFITDGAVGNEEALFRLIHDGLGSARLFTVGIGAAPNAFFMSRAAEFGRGTYTFIGDAGEVSLKMDQLFTRLESPVLTDIDIHWPQNLNAETWPKIPPDLYAGQPLVVTTRVRSVAGSILISGANGNGHWLRQPNLDPGQTHPGVSALWARNKIRSLMSSRVNGGDPEKIRAEVTAVALEHHLVSRYTSLVAVDKAPARPAGSSLGTGAVPSLMPAVMRDSLFAGYPRGATSAAFRFLLGAMLILFAAGVHGLLRRRTSIRREVSCPAAN